MKWDGQSPWKLRRPPQKKLMNRVSKASHKSPKSTFYADHPQDRQPQTMIDTKRLDARQTNHSNELHVDELLLSALLPQIGASFSKT